jgi:hypothetical protein
MVTTMVEYLAELAERPRWSVTDIVATYAPQQDGWTAQLCAVCLDGYSGPQWHITIIDPLGRAFTTYFASVLDQAARLAEKHVQNRNAA